MLVVILQAECESWRSVLCPCSCPVSSPVAFHAELSPVGITSSQSILEFVSFCLFRKYTKTIATKNRGISLRYKLCDTEMVSMANIVWKLMVNRQ